MREWCREWLAGDDRGPAADGDGERLVFAARGRTVGRGGFSGTPAEPRVSNRHEKTDEVRLGTLVVRPSRPLRD